MALTTTPTRCPSVGAPGHEHGLGDIAGYLVVVTDARFGSHVVREVVEAFEGAGTYGEAVALAQALRTEIHLGQRDGTYAVVDTVYVSGCSL